MEPIPESTRADDWFGPFLLDDEDLLPLLRRLGVRLVELVPACVGLSVSMLEHDVTFTVASSAPPILLLDAFQYADDGPCLAAVGSASAVSWSDEDAEEKWRTFAAASASAGVASTLSFPIVRDERVVGGFNLYASTPHAFDGHHQEVADLLGGWAGGATTNADLSFTTRDLARQAPEKLHDQTRLAVAGALLAQALWCDHDAAVERLRRAAHQAALPLPTVVEGTIAILGPKGAG